MTPYDEDQAIAATAEALGMEVLRMRAVVISDEKAVKAAGFTRTAIDYKRLRKHLEDGGVVPGASLGPVEYTLRHPSVKDGELAEQ